MTGQPAGARGRRGLTHLMTLVARRDYLRTVRRRGFVAGTVLLPAGIAALFVLSAALGPGFDPDSPGAVGDYRLAVVDESDLGLAPIPELTPHVEVVTREQGLALIASGDLDELYVVPPTYPDDRTVTRIDGGEGGGGVFGGLQRQAAQRQELATLLITALLERANVPPESALQIISPMIIRSQTTGGEPVPSEPSLVSFLVPLGFTLVFVMSIFITSGYLLQSVTEEKENRVVEIVLSSVPALPLMAGKILGLGAAGLTQVAVWFITAVVAIAVLGSQVPDLDSLALSPVVVPLGLGYFALGYLAYGAIFSAVGALSPGSREAQQYAGFVGFLAAVPLIFSSIFLTDLGSPIVTALALVPFTTPAAMLLVVSLSPEPPWPLVAASFASLAAFALLATIASARVFRATLLLYGVRPSVRSIIGAVFARD